jgi:hypothetical protein
VCVCVCVCVRVRVHVRACVRACVSLSLSLSLSVCVRHTQATYEHEEAHQVEGGSPRRDGPLGEDAGQLHTLKSHPSRPLSTRFVHAERCQRRASDSVGSTVEQVDLAP